MKFDVVIVGGGLAGASLAVALADSKFEVALIERRPPAQPGPEWDSRVYSLTPASIAFLDEIGVWSRLEQERITPVYDMRVFGDDRRSNLRFSAYEAGVRQLAATVESNRLQHAMWRALERRRKLSLLCPEAPVQLRSAGDGVEIGLEGGRSLSARLAVGADGADSWLRHAAGIQVRRRNYGQQGVVANFACARMHRNTAYQWFRRDGVLAYLPLPQERISMVWSTSDALARELLDLPPAQLCRRVAEAGGEALGSLEALTPPAAFPLMSMNAEQLTRGRVALVGDAAHVVHPLAGQGINLGFGDAHALADLLRDAPDPGDRLLLRRFERARAEDILAMRLVTDGLQRLFNADYPAIARIRNLGLNLTDSLPVIKTLLTRRAVGAGAGLRQKEPT
ncbi:MAG TPA: UbiH/UbiF family hydroxylase [Burkholderiales bacterium]|jgi:ubiquinone biosynthesis UbiH/UbiF/VisC/COQ6 family hydroxylase